MVGIWRQAYCWRSRLTDRGYPSPRGITWKGPHVEMSIVHRVGVVAEAFEELLAGLVGIMQGRMTRSSQQTILLGGSSPCISRQATSRKLHFSANSSRWVTAITQDALVARRGR